MSSEELRVSEPMLFLFLYRFPHSATPFPPSQCVRPSSAQISALSGSPFFKPCDHVGKSTSVASGAWVIFFFVVTTQHRSAWRQQGRYLSSLSSPPLSNHASISFQWLPGRSGWSGQPSERRQSGVRLKTKPLHLFSVQLQLFQTSLLLMRRIRSPWIFCWITHSSMISTDVQILCF